MDAMGFVVRAGSLYERLLDAECSAQRTGFVAREIVGCNEKCAAQRAGFVAREIV